MDTANPYKGLRTFEPSDRLFFCGRTTHVGEILQRLHKNRFVAVVGLSGSGKSSLVRAGLIPELLTDRLKDASSDWLIVMITPERAPLSRIGNKLCETVKAHFTMKRANEDNDIPAPETVDKWAASVDEAMNSGSLGLAKAIATSGLAPRTQVLLVIDQFEELFRYYQRNEKQDAESFIQQILEVSSDEEDRVYVVITMRSEYLGDCAHHQGLAEAVNAGLYLTPRLNRDQLEQAITLPAKRLGRIITPELVRQLLNDIANDQDQLPVLQHALMRCWEKSVELNSTIINEEQYILVGGSRALNNHAEKIFNHLGDGAFGADHDGEAKAGGKRKQQIAKALFKRITKLSNREGISQNSEKETDGTRDPASLHTISAQTGILEEELRDVIDVFRREDCAFLRPGAETQVLKSESIIDITHESLIRKWDSLGRWVQEEAESADLYRKLAAEAEKAPATEHLSQYEVALYKSWESSTEHGVQWAKRYGGNYEQALQYLSNSAAHYKTRRRLLWGLSVAVPVVVCALIAVIFSWRKSLISSERVQDLTFEQEAEIAQNDNYSPTDRVPAVITAASIAERSGDDQLRQALNLHVRLDQWELLNTLRKGLPINSFGGTSRVKRSCAAAVDPTGRLVALADGKELKVWELDLAVRQAQQPKGVSGVSFTSYDFKGVDCVRFRQDGAKLELLATSFSHEPSRTQIGQPEIREYTVEQGELKPAPKIQMSIHSPLAFTFVKDSDKVAVLTEDELTIYSGVDKMFSTALDYANGDVVAGFVEAKGGYIVVSYKNGDSEIYDLRSPSLQHHHLDFDGKSQVINIEDTLQAVAFSSDASWIVTGSYKGRIEFLKNPLLPISKPSKPLEIAEMTGSISTVALQENGNEELIAVGTVLGDTAVFRNSPTINGRPPRPAAVMAMSPSYSAIGFPPQGSITQISFANRGENLITASEDQKVRIFEVRNGVEKVRIPHNSPVRSATALPVGSGRDDRIISVSQDADLEVTDLNTEKPTVLRNWQSETCPAEEFLKTQQSIWSSAVSVRGSWTWVCNGALHSSDKNKTALPLADFVPTSIHFNEDESAVVWLDSQVGIHYARWNTNQWQMAPVEHWKDISQRPMPSLTPQSIPLLAVSRDGNFWAISFMTEGEGRTEVFQVIHPKEAKPTSSSLHAEAVVNVDQLKPSIPPTSKRVLSLAVGLQGTVAMGTAEGDVLRFARKDNAWKPSTMGFPKDKFATLGPQDRVITAVTFADDSDSKLIVAMANKSILLFSADGKILYPVDDSALAGHDVPARAFALRSDGKKFAAISGEFATFYTIDGESLERGLTLKEPGPIQSLALAENDTALVSVFSTDSLSLVEITHNLNIRKHEQWLCSHQPVPVVENSPEINGCSQLQNELHWSADWTFWPKTTGEPSTKNLK